MLRQFKFFAILLIAVVFYTSGFWIPQFLNSYVTVSLAVADNNGNNGNGNGNNNGNGNGNNNGNNGGGNGNNNDKPPTVSELSIQYMIPAGLALILMAGGFVALVRRRQGKTS